MGNARHEAMSAEAYHEHDAIGASMLEDFRASRRWFQGVYVTKQIPKPRKSRAMTLGTLAHLRLLQPELYAESIAEPLPALAPDGKKWYRLEGSDHARWWQEELDKRAGKISASDEMLEAVEQIAANVLDNWHARRLLDRDGEPEFPIFWKDAATGLECKCMVDWWSTIPLDLKTTRDPSPRGFAYQCFQLGYHRKRAHYASGIAQFAGPDLPLLHLAVGNEEPYQVCVYELDDLDGDGASLGYRQYRKTLADLARCFDTDDWSEPYEREIVKLRLPRTAFFEDQYEL